MADVVDIKTGEEETKGTNISSYKPEYDALLIEMMTDGASFKQVAAALGHSDRTMRRWKKNNPTWDEACELGKTLAESWWENMGRQGMAGKEKVNAAIWIFTMKNRFGWTDRQEIDTGSKNQTIKAAIEQAANGRK